MDETSLSEESRRALLDRVLALSFQRGRFQLSSGAWSDTYIDLRRTTLDPQGLTCAAATLWPILRATRAQGVGGPTLGADPLVAALLLRAAAERVALQGFLVRSAAKDHGTGRQIEGHCAEGDRVVVLDDVVTRGGSILRAAAAARAQGAQVVQALALVDREEGGREALAAEGIPLFTPLRLAEILAEAQARGL
jgi:orotate phosphoribosyltransferase